VTFLNPTHEEKIITICYYEFIWKKFILLCFVVVVIYKYIIYIYIIYIIYIYIYILYIYIYNIYNIIIYIYITLKLAKETESFGSSLSKNDSIAGTYDIRNYVMKAYCREEG